MAHKSKQEITAIIASVLLAFIVWIYAMTDQNPMENDTIDNIPVQLINTEVLEQYNLTLSPEQNFTVSLNIRGRALDIYTADPANFKIVADLNNAAFFQKGENNIPVEVRGIPTGIQIQNPTGVPYYIKVKLERLDSKSVPVKINLSGSVKEGYGYLDEIIKPSEVVVRGPESYVNLVDRAEGQIDINGKSNLVNESVVIKPVDKDGNEVKYVALQSQVADVAVPIKPAKEVSLVVKTTGSITGNKTLKGINQSLDRIMILGDKKDIDKIEEIQTLPYDISRIRANYKDKLQLNIPEGIDVISNITTVDVEFLVEDIIEKTLKIQSSIINSREGYSYTPSVSEINITIRGGQSIINSVNTGSISAVLDVGGLDAGNHNVDVKINLPSGVNLAGINPDKVAVTVTKPAEETTGQ